MADTTSSTSPSESIQNGNLSNGTSIIANITNMISNLTTTSSTELSSSFVINSTLSPISTSIIDNLNTTFGASTTSNQNGTAVTAIPPLANLTVSTMAILSTELGTTSIIDNLNTTFGVSTTSNQNGTAVTAIPPLVNLTVSTMAILSTELGTTSSLNTTLNRTSDGVSSNAGQQEISLDTLYGIFILNGIMSLLGILGNIFVCLIIIRGRKMYTIANLFLMNLAIADTCVLLISYPLWVLQTLTPNSWPFGAFLCKILPSISDAFYGISLGCMTAIALHRYRMILHAFDRQLSFRQAKFIVIFIWLISLVTISVPLYPVYQFSTQTKTNIAIGNLSTQMVPPYTMCRSVWPTRTYEAAYQIFLAILWYLLPLLIILFTFLRIKWYLEKKMTYDWLKGTENSLLVAHHITGIKKALRMLAPIVIIFALLLLPWNVIRMISLIINIGKVPHIQIYIVIAGTMLVANSVINPFIYYLMSSEFRLEFKKQFWLLKKRFGMAKHSDKFTITEDKRGRKFVRRHESFTANDSTVLFTHSYTPHESKSFNVSGTPEITELSMLRFAPGSPDNDYGEIFQCGKENNDDYANLRYSPSLKSPLNDNSGLYKIVEERSVDIDYKDFFEREENLNDDTETDNVDEDCLEGKQQLNNAKIINNNINNNNIRSRLQSNENESESN